MKSVFPFPQRRVSKTAHSTLTSTTLNTIAPTITISNGKQLIIGEKFMVDDGWCLYSVIQCKMNRIGFGTGGEGRVYIRIRSKNCDAISLRPLSTFCAFLVHLRPAERMQTFNPPTTLKFAHSPWISLSRSLAGGGESENGDFSDFGHLLLQ